MVEDGRSKRRNILRILILRTYARFLVPFVDIVPYSLL